MVVIVSDFGLSSGFSANGLFGRQNCRGEDIRNYGSGNIGAANVEGSWEKGGPLWSGIFDIVKGGLALLIAKMLGVTSLKFCPSWAWWRYWDTTFQYG